MIRVTFRTRLSRAWADTGFRWRDVIVGVLSVFVIYIVLRSESTAEAAWDEVLAILAGFGVFGIAFLVEFAFNLHAAAYRLQIEYLKGELESAATGEPRPSLRLHCPRDRTDIKRQEPRVEIQIHNDGSLAAEGVRLYLTDLQPPECVERQDFPASIISRDDLHINAHDDFRTWLLMAVKPREDDEDQTTRVDFYTPYKASVRLSPKQVGVAYLKVTARNSEAMTRVIRIQRDPDSHDVSIITGDQ